MVDVAPHTFKPRRMVVLVGAGTGAAAALLAYRWIRAGHDTTVLGTSSLARGVEVARLSSKVGGSYATTQARRVFASAERKTDLDENSSSRRLPRSPRRSVP